MPGGHQPAGPSGPSHQVGQSNTQFAALEPVGAPSASKLAGNRDDMYSGSEAGVLQTNRLTPEMTDIMSEYVAPYLPTLVLSEFRECCSQLQYTINPETCEHLAKQKALAETIGKGQCNADASCWLIPPSWDSHPRKTAKAPDGSIGSSSFICQLWEKTIAAIAQGRSTYSILVTETVSGYAAQIKLFDGQSSLKDSICIDWLTSHQLFVRFKEQQGSDCRGLVYSFSTHAGVSLQQDFLYPSGSDSLVPLGLLSPDGSSLLCQHDSNSAYILSLPAGAEVAQLQLPDISQQLTSMQWAPADSKQHRIAVSSASASAAHVHIFAADDGALLHSSQLPEQLGLVNEASAAAAKAPEMALTWAPKGRAISISMESGLVWILKYILSKSSSPPQHGQAHEAVRETPAADVSALPAASCSFDMQPPSAMIHLQTKDLPVCKWDPSGQILACFAGEQGAHGCLVHAATGSTLHRWDRRPEGPEPQPSTAEVTPEPSQVLQDDGTGPLAQAAQPDLSWLSRIASWWDRPYIQRMMDACRQQDLVRDPMWLAEGHALSIFIPALHQIISIHPRFDHDQTQPAIKPAVTIREVPLSSDAQPSPCGRLYVDVDDSGPHTAHRSYSWPTFHYSPDTGAIYHLGIMVCRRKIDNFLIQPHQLILQWIPDLATSLSYACIGQDAIYIVDGLQHSKLAEIHTEAMMFAMGIVPRDHLEMTDEQNDLLQAEQVLEEVANDTRHVFCESESSSL